MAQIIDGKKTSTMILENLKEEIKNKPITPCLAVVLVGNDKASSVYVNSKKKKCNELGIKSISHELPAETSEDELLSLIDELNKDKGVHGILVQLPLPKHINEKLVINKIDEKKDVDCFHPINVGLLNLGQGVFKPCTPYGIIKLLETYNIDLEGKHCVVIGRSNIVGKPLVPLLLEKNATVTVCHSRTKNLNEITKQADVLISAVGRINMVTKDMVKEDAVVIDVGINRDENNKLCGDVDFENVKEKASFITPVPGGVGPMTIAMLMNNCVNAI